MSNYTAPVEDMGFVLREVVELDKLCSETGLDTSSIDIIDTVLYAADAHELLQSRQATGSIVLKPQFFI